MNTDIHCATHASTTTEILTNKVIIIICVSLPGRVVDITIGIATNSIDAKNFSV